MDMSEFDRHNSKGYKIAVGGAKSLIRLLLLVALVVAVIYFGKRLYNIGYEAMSSSPVHAKGGVDISFEITEDMSVKDIAESLSKMGLINESEGAFIIQSYIYSNPDKIIPGKYILNTGMTVEEMLKIITTVPEGEEAGEGA